MFNGKVWKKVNTVEQRGDFTVTKDRDTTLTTTHAASPGFSITVTKLNDFFKFDLEVAPNSVGITGLCVGVFEPSEETTTDENLSATHVS